MPTLRPYQHAAVDRLREAVRAGKRRCVLVLPTGGGKTVVMSEIVRSFCARPDARAIVIVHRSELVDQTLAKLEAVDIRAGVIMGSDARIRTDARVQVCSIQTLARRIDRLPQAGLVIYDECHHACSRTAREVLARYQSSIVLGFTATPWRSDGQGLADIFETVVCAATPRDLIESGALVDADCYAYDAPDLHKVKVTAGEYNQKQLEVAANTDVLVGSLVKEYAAHARGKQALIFPVTCEHSQHIVRDMRAAGFRAEHIDWSTPRAERAAIIEAFRTQQVTALSSVGVLTEGFDAPSAEVCILARPTKSLSLYVQMVGRVLRPSPGKGRALVHDHAGNIFRHGFPDDCRGYSLSPTTSEPRERMACTECGYMTGRWPANGLCPRCGSLQHIPDEEREASERRRGKPVVEGRRIGRDEIARIREQFASAGIRRELSDAHAAKVAAATRADKAAEFLRLKAVAEAKGFKPGFAAHQYRSTFGVWPKFADGELDGVLPAAKPFLPIQRREDA